jgi:hypothetical protein
MKEPRFDKGWLEMDLETLGFIELFTRQHDDDTVSKSNTNSVLMANYVNKTDQIYAEMNKTIVNAILSCSN